MDEILIPNTSLHDVVSFDLVVDKKSFGETLELLSLTVTKEINRIPSAHIVIRDGDAAERTFAISNQTDFAPGKSIKISIGYDGDNEQVFKGIIVRHSIKLKENGDGELHVECQDITVKMSLGRRSKYFNDVTDKQVFDDLIGEYNSVNGNFDSTMLNHKELIQHHISDWDFMLLRAEANGMLVNVDDGSIKISKPNTNVSPALEVAYGSSIVEFEAEMDIRNQWASVQAKSWDFNNQKLFSAESDSASSFSENGNISGSKLAKSNDLDKYEMHHSGHVLEQELQDWADGLMLRSRMAKIRGHARVEGFSGIKAGDMIKLSGVGERFEGKAFVTAIKHEIGLGSWETHIQFGLDPKRFAFCHNDMNSLPASGLLGCIHGLQIGTVVKLQDDPDGQDRILVKIPMIDDNAQGIWTRIASLDAGSNRGAFFRPEIEDEVIVGFVNDDPRDAIVLGMLHSSAKPAPITAQDDNDEKGFTTRSDMHLLFNDKTKTITIDTPAGNKIILDEEGTKIEITDQNDNSITMDPAGIKIESQKNIEIKAGINISMEAAAAFSIKGATVSAKADGNISIEGAIAKLAAQGVTEISGSMVKIN